MATTKRATREADVAPKAFALLRGIGNSETLRTAMVRAGYSAAEHTTGWRLLDQVAARDVDLTVTSRQPLDPEEGVTGWRNSPLPRLRAALQRLHPEHAAQLLPDAGARACICRWAKRSRSPGSPPWWASTRGRCVVPSGSMRRRPGYLPRR
jgi:hypothetical protein